MNIRVKQRDISDCGAACLASVARFYNLDVAVTKIRQHAGTNQKGTNLAGMLEAAKYLGFDAKGVRGTLESLFQVQLPVIAHIIVSYSCFNFCIKSLTIFNFFIIFYLCNIL